MKQSQGRVTRGEEPAFVVQVLLHSPTRPRHQGPRGRGGTSLPRFREKQQQSKVLPGIGGLPAFHAEGPRERACLCRRWGPLSAEVSVRQRGHPDREGAGTPCPSWPRPHLLRRDQDSDPPGSLGPGTGPPPTPAASSTVQTSRCTARETTAVIFYKGNSPPQNTRGKTPPV